MQLQILLENIAYLVRISYENKKCNRNWIRFRYIVARSTPLALAHWLPNLYLYFCVFVFVYFCIFNRNWVVFRYIVAHWALNMKSDAMGLIFAKQSTAQYAAMVDSVGRGISVMLLPHLRFCICALAFLYLCISLCAQRQVCVVQAGYLSCKSAWSVLDNPMDHFAFAWAWIWTELVQNLYFRASASE